MSGEENKPSAMIYELRMTDNGPEVTLSQVHQKLLLFIAHHGGETRYDFSLLDEGPEEKAFSVAKYGEPLREHVRRLVTMGLLTETPIISTPRSLLRLTDTGRNIVTEIRKRPPIIITDKEK